MNNLTVTCPSCGAGHEIRNPGVIMVVCEYCGNAIYWDKEKIQNAGKQSTLPEGFTRLYRGAAGSLFKKRFVVLGRVRYSFGRGFWDEWFLEFEDGSTGWLSEDNQELCLEAPMQGAAVGQFESHKIGDKLKIEDKEFVVEEVGLAECIGVEGDLPFHFATGEKYQFVDASSPDGHYTLGIEYDNDPPTVFRGNWLSYASVKLDDEGNDW